MDILKTELNDLILIRPDIFSDNRGFFYESWNVKSFNKFLNKQINFVQDNHSRSKRGTLRGLHYQLKKPQAKLVRVVKGRVIDVALDLRKSSSTFGKYFSVELSEDNKLQMWIPEGFAHGFIAISEQVDFCYKTTEFYFPDDEHTIIWNDTDIQIDWMLNNIEPIVSDKDRLGVNFKDASYFD